jgi:hypothetical protein
MNWHHHKLWSDARFQDGRETSLTPLNLHTSSAYILWLDSRRADVSRYHVG